jgi:FMN phosphatase YigB (HAD superfamily)
VTGKLEIDRIVEELPTILPEEMQRPGSLQSAIRVILFDIGGVLVGTSGVATMLAWMENRVSAEQLWKLWLTSPDVRAFETGRLSPEEFADRVITDFHLPIRREQFLQEMTQWSVAPFRGVVEMIERIPDHYVRATLCNTNVIHWKYLMRNEKLMAAFSHHFASHLMGKIKPDAEAFQHVTHALQCDPQAVLFLDDNELNVVGARSIGMQAVRVRGITEAEQALVTSGVLED